MEREAFQRELAKYKVFPVSHLYQVLLVIPPFLILTSSFNRLFDQKITSSPERRYCSFSFSCLSVSYFIANFHFHPATWNQAYWGSPCCKRRSQGEVAQGCWWIGVAIVLGFDQSGCPWIADRRRNRTIFDGLATGNFILHMLSCGASQHNCLPLCVFVCVSRSVRTTTMCLRWSTWKTWTSPRRCFKSISLVLKKRDVLNSVFELEGRLWYCGRVYAIVLWVDSRLRVFGESQASSTGCGVVCSL